MWYKYSYSKKFISYHDARTWASERKIKSKEQWRLTPRPPYIPYHPEEVYPEWVSWKDFLNNYVTYEEAKKWAKDNNIYTRSLWKEKSPFKPENIPDHPENFYPEWVSWKDFLNYKHIPDKYNRFRDNKVQKLKDIKKIKQWALENGITSYEKWMNTQKPDYIPHFVNKLQGFKSWNDFFTPESEQPIQQQTNKKPVEKKYAPLNQVNKWMRQQGITTPEEYQNSPYKLDNFPPTLDFYKKSMSFNLYKYSQSKKILYIMRGLPGSGKSTLAQQLGQGGVVFSTDDFFMKDNQYNFDPKMLSQNHNSNYQRTVEAMKQGISPIVVDNTSVQLWTMKNYILAANQYNYQIEFKEPKTEWAWNAHELAKRNTHKVPLKSIEKMIQQYEPNASIEEILKSKNPNENNVD